MLIRTGPVAHRRRWRTIVSSLAAVLLLVPPSLPARAATPSPSKVDAGVETAISTNGAADFWVELSDQADLSGAAAVADWAERGRWVVDKLKSVSTASQTGVIADLKALNAVYTPFWAANRVFVKGGGRAALDSLAARAEVARISAPRTYQLPEETQAAAPADFVEWNIEDIGANQVWEQFGVRGEGVVVGSIDSGVEFEHPALVDRYRGRKPDGTFDHNYNWFDPERVCTASGTRPCDDDGHGTHTMGIAVGDGGEDLHFGVAPAAQWITAKACRPTTCSDFALMAAGQWMLAPTDLKGGNPDPARRPQVITFSIVNPDGRDPFYRPVVQAWLASGQFGSFANGETPIDKCSTVASPAAYPEAYGVNPYSQFGGIGGAFGPSPFDAAIKPNLAAPGFSIFSSTLGGGYELRGGSSMAAAHVAGAAALVLSAAGALSGDVHGTRSLLDSTAGDAFDFLGCGGPPEKNNVWGEGRLHVLTAVSKAIEGFASPLNGTVTDSVSQQPVAGALVEVTGGNSTATSAEGLYHLFLYPGDYDVTISAYGYDPQTFPVTASPGEEIVRNVALVPQSGTTISGRVTDGGGHGWPLAARIDIAGFPGSPIFTDPATGLYSVDLKGGAHKLTVSAELGGYIPETRQLAVPPDATTQDFALLPDPDCRAPGYHLGSAGLFEAFDGGLPDGWQVVNNTGGSQWRFDDPGGRTNQTGGEGTFAIVDSDAAGPGDLQDTELVSPLIDLTGAAEPVVRFATDVRAFSDENFDVDLSIDGGGTWDNIWHKAGEEGFGNLRGPRIESVPVPQAAGQPDVRVRFHYHVGDFDYWWQVDDVLVAGGGGCVKDAGGLVAGLVTDAVTDAPLAGAQVRGAGSGEAASSLRGTYALFAPAGNRSFTASSDGFEDETRTVNVVGDTTVRLDLALDSGRLVFDPEEIVEEVEPGGRRTVNLKVTNDGTAPASFSLQADDRGSEGESAPASGSSPTVTRVPVENVQLGWISSTAAAGPEPVTAASEGVWERVAPYPVRVFDQASVTGDGKVYSVGGVSGELDIDDLFIYDPATDHWEAGPEMSYGRTRPGAAFIDGKLYVVGGWDDGGRPLRKLEVYDPVAREWSAGPDMPAARAAAGVAVAGGKLYVVGGCVVGGCGPDDGVYRFDPETGSWEALAAYPFDVAHTACGGVLGVVYCAGGFDRSLTAVPDAFGYDDASDTWLPAPPLPFPLGLTNNAVASGRLVLVGGIDERNFQVDSTLAFDPVSSTWEFFEPRADASYRGSAACGLYSIGGITPQHPFPRVRLVERLGGFDTCEERANNWLTLDRTTGELAPGESVTIHVTVDAGDLQPGSYFSALGVDEDTPRIVQPVFVEMKVARPASWGTVQGVISGLGRCDSPGSPLSNADVSANGLSSVSGRDGRYSLSADAAGGPVAVTFQAPGYLDKTVQVTLAAGQTVTSDVNLNLDRPCVSADPERVNVQVVQGATATAPLTLRNTGPRSASARAGETEFALDPVAPSNAVDAQSPPGRLPDRSRPDPGGVAPSWFQGTPALGYMDQYGAAQCDGDPNRFYLATGITAGVYTDTLARYDSTDNSWTELAPLPQDAWPGDFSHFGVAQPAAVCEAGRIHVMGGYHQAVPQDTHFVYDIGAGSWSTAAPLPRKVFGAAAASWNGKIYLAGGAVTLSDGTTDEVDVYDIATDTWAVLPARMPLRTERAASVQAGRYLYLLGGADDLGPPVNYKQTQRLDLVTGTWSMGPPLPRESVSSAMAATGTAVYLISGWTLHPNGFATQTDKVMRLETASWPAGTWTQLDLTPYSAGNNKGYCTEGVTGGEISVAGGFGNGFIFRNLLMRSVAPERCPTIRSDVSWLSVDQVSSTIAAGGSKTLSVKVDAKGLTPGSHVATLLVETTDPGAPELRVPVTVEVGAAPPVTAYVSLATAATVGGVAVADEDIVALGPAGSVTPYFDGSDVGASGLALDAFARLADGSLVLSFTAPGTLPGVPGTVDDSDLVRFRPDSLGATTAGSYEMWFDGSDVGLSTTAENLDSVEVLNDGRVVVSTTGDAKLTGLTATDEDLLIFTPQSLGATTAGLFALWFDGSDVAMAASSEDVDAAALRGDGAILLSTTGVLGVTGLAAGKEDVVAFSPSRLGPTTAGSFAPAPVVDGSTIGLKGQNISGVELP